MATFSPAIREFLAAPEATRRLGPYRCKDLLDKAGTAPVFKAVEEHAGLGLREVAIKVFDIGRAKGIRVVDEARALCLVQHPNVIRFHTLSTDDKRGLMGLVMEFAEGVSVDRQLAEIPRGDVRRVALAVEIGVAIASALAAAHEAGVVHCNVKPSNIMFTGGTHKLINFGIAASLREAESARGDQVRKSLELDDLPPDSIGSKAAALDKADGEGAAAPIAGSIGYVDPVCVKTTAAPIPASDLYSLGATLYQCLAGDVPAVAEAKRAGTGKVDAKVLTGDAPPLSVAEAADAPEGVPPDLAKLVDALVAPARADRPKSADAVRRSLERIRSALAGRERTLPAEERGPFPGLDRYEAADRDVFFGRSAEIAGVIELLRTRGLVGVVGLSGTGKSSLTRAGVVPAIEEGALGGWPARYRRVLVTPGTDLMGALRAALSKVVGRDLADHPAAIAQQLADDVDATGEGLVILVDQLEEIVSLHDADDAAATKGRLQALDLFTRLAEAPVGLRVVVVVRRDRLDDVQALDPHFARALSRGVHLVAPLSSAAWQEVVDQGLEAYGYELETADLRRDVLADVGARESAMTLAQFGLARLWGARIEAKKVIPRSAFDAKEGMRRALEQHADAAVAGLKAPRDTVREVILAMTTPEGTRAHASREQLTGRLGAAATEVIDALVAARLVISEKAGLTFVHDSLLRDWALVRGWIQEARDDRLLVAQLERDAGRWEQSRDPADLWRKGRLAAALELWRRGSAPVSETARTFLRKSRSEEEKAKMAFFGLIVVIVMLIVGGSFWYAKESRDRADEARRDADALSVALAEVKALKRQTEENALEAAASAALLDELQRKLSANVDATIKKVANAKNLDAAQKATADLKGPQAPVVALPKDLTAGLGTPKLGIDTSGPSPAGGGGTFDQASIERVVNSRKAGVKRTCLERSTSTAASTKVTATLTIAPNGSVQNVTSAGDDPVIAKCIETQLRSWSFPAPGDVQTVQIPFVFVRQ